ncbi:hypothetical protein Tco_1021297, partial [Tanacetum coccineum]
MYLNDEEDDGDNMIIPQTPSKEIRTRIDNNKCPPSLLNEIGEDEIWEKIKNPLSPNHIERGGEGKQRAKAYRREDKLLKISEDKVQASPNFKAKIKTQATSMVLFIFV